MGGLLSFSSDLVGSGVVMRGGIRPTLLTTMMLDVLGVDASGEVWLIYRGLDFVSYFSPLLFFGILEILCRFKELSKPSLRHMHFQPGGSVTLHTALPKSFGKTKRKTRQQCANVFRMVDSETLTHVCLTQPLNQYRRSWVLPQICPDKNSFGGGWAPHTPQLSLKNKEA